MRLIVCEEAVTTQMFRTNCVRWQKRLKADETWSIWVPTRCCRFHGIVGHSVAALRHSIPDELSRFFSESARAEDRTPQGMRLGRRLRCGHDRGGHYLPPRLPDARRKALNPGAGGRAPG
jgi:hypothetical protein